MSIRSVLKSFFETGDKPTQAEFGDLIDSTLNLDEDTTDVLTEGSTNLYYTVPPYIHLTKSTTQTSSMTFGTTTLVLWEIELHKDTGFTHDNVTNNSEIQVDADGLYKLEQTLDMNPLTGSAIVYYTYYVINGVTTVLRGRTWGGSRGQFQGLTLFAQTEITLTAGDYIEIYYYVSYSIASGNNTLKIEGTELTLRKIG